jgi:hypothetical protein
MRWEITLKTDDDEPGGRGGSITFIRMERYTDGNNLIRLHWMPEVSTALHGSDSHWNTLGIRRPVNLLYCQCEQEGAANIHDVLYLEDFFPNGDFTIQPNKSGTGWVTSGGGKTFPEYKFHWKCDAGTGSGGDSDSDDQNDSSDDSSD